MLADLQRNLDSRTFLVLQKGGLYFLYAVGFFWLEMFDGTEVRY